MTHMKLMRPVHTWLAARRSAPARAMVGLPEWQGEGGVGALDVLPLLLKLIVLAGALAGIGVLAGWSRAHAVGD